MTKALQAALRDMLGPDVGIGITDPCAPTSPLWDAEHPAMARAIPKRLAEFTAGRQAARAAMADLGLPPAAIPLGKDRAPLWPAGLVGSISHTDDLCIAIVSQDHSSLGIDVEPATALEQELWETICTPSEQAWMQTRPDPGLGAKMLFCAKEAVYKAQYPLTGQVIEFTDVFVTFDLEQGLFQADFGPQGPRLAPLDGQVIVQDGVILAAICHS